MKRAKVTSTIVASLIIISCAVIGIIYNTLASITSAMLFTFVFIIIGIIEESYIGRKVRPFLELKNYDDAIKYLENKLIKTLLLNSAIRFAVTLINLYAFIGENKKARDLLKKHYKLIKNNSDLFYIQMLFMLDEDRIDEAKEYMNKIMNLKADRYFLQKHSTLKIIRMLGSKKFDESLYNETNIPLLKEICLKYKDENEESKEILDKETDFDFDFDQNPKSKLVKPFSIILNSLTIISIFIGLIIITNIIGRFGPVSSMDSQYYTVKYSLIFLLFLPVSFGNIIFGAYFKARSYITTSNIVIGIVISLLLFIFGMMFTFVNHNTSENPEILYNYEELINIDFPDEFRIVTQDNIKTIEKSKDNNYIKNISVLKFTNDIEVENFRNSFDGSNWVEGYRADVFSNLPEKFVFETRNYHYFLTYSVDTGEFNPDDFVIDNTYISIAFNRKLKSLIIYEYIFSTN